MSLMTKPRLSWSWRQKFPLKFQYISKRTHCITFQEMVVSWKTSTWRTSHLIIMRYNKRGNARSPNHSWRGEAIIITYSACVYVCILIIHNVKLLRLTMLSPVTCLSLPHFPTLSHKRYYFGKKLLNIKFVFWYSLQLLPETFLILRRSERDTIIRVYWFPCKVPVILVTFEWNLNFLNRFSKSTQIPNFIKIPHWERSCSMRTDRLTDDGANSRFSQFCERV
jgi:hypothetical protein